MIDERKIGIQRIEGGDGSGGGGRADNKTISHNNVMMCNNNDVNGNHNNNNNNKISSSSYKNIKEVDGGGGDHDDEKLPPGFRFHPTDEELLTYYLNNKISNSSSFTARAIAEIDLNKCEPWDLPAKAKMGEKEWYFFSLRDRKYPTGLRTNRATDAGYWKTTGKDKEIFNSTTSTSLELKLVGMKKTLVFYKGRAPKGEKTNWVMHEYRLIQCQLQHKNNSSKSNKDEWAVCRVFQKSSGGGKKYAQQNTTPVARNNINPFINITNDHYHHTFGQYGSSSSSPAAAVLSSLLYSNNMGLPADLADLTRTMRSAGPLNFNHLCNNSQPQISMAAFPSALHQFGLNLNLPLLVRQNQLQQEQQAGRLMMFKMDDGTSLPTVLASPPFDLTSTPTLVINSGATNSLATTDESLGRYSVDGHQAADNGGVNVRMQTLTEACPELLEGYWTPTF